MLFGKLTLTHLLTERNHRNAKRYKPTKYIFVRVTANKFVLSPILPAKKSNEVIENKSRTQSTFYKYGSYTQKKIQNPTNSNQENHSRKKIHEN